MVDWDHGTVYEDLHEIAHNMLCWDALAPQLGLDDVDVADIKHDHRTAEQQRLGYHLLVITHGTRYILPILCVRLTGEEFIMTELKASLV